MAYILENGKRINYTFEEGKVIYSDGKIAIPSVDNIDVKKAYSEAKVPIVVPPIIDPPIIIIPPNKPREIGSKELSNLKDVKDEKFVLKPGIYSGSHNLHNLNNVSIDGLDKVLFQGGSRALKITGSINNLTLSNFSLKDVSDRQIVMEDIQTKRWKDGIGDFVDGITLYNLHSEGGGNLFHSNGDVRDGVHLGLIKNFKMSMCSFKNSSAPGMVVYLGNAMGYDISNNIVDNINQSSNDHNGIFMLKGNGKFRGNKITSHQGSSLRAWLFSHNVTPDVVEIFNNIVYNSRKYGAFEIQTPEEYKLNGFKAANAIVHNNTAGHLNTSKDWHGQMLDVYYTGGTLEYYDNLGFEMNKSIGGSSISTGITDMINYAGDSPKIIRSSGNLYFDKSDKTVVDTLNFKSLHKGIGAQ